MVNDPQQPALHWLTAAIVKTGLASNLSRARILQAVPTDAAASVAWDLAARAFELSQEQISRIVGAAYGLQVANTRFLEPEAATFLPEEVARQLGVIPVRHTDVTIVVATANPLDMSIEGRVNALSGRRTILSVASPTDIAAAQDRVYGAAQPADFVLTNLRLQTAMQRVELPAKVQTLPSRGGAVDRLIRLILFEAVKAHATEISLEPRARGGRITFILGGESRTVVFLPIAVTLRIMARVRYWARSGFLDERGRMVARVDGERFELELKLEGREPLDPIRVEVIGSRGSGTPQPRVNRPASQPEESWGTAPVALVVDDEPGDRLLLRTMLKRSGFEIVEAEDGVEALTRLQSDQDFDVVLLDLMMPRMSGLEVLTRIRETVRTAGMPVIVVTASEDPEDRKRLLEAGADDYLQKPINPPRVAERVRALLRRSMPVG